MKKFLAVFLMSFVVVFSANAQSLTARVNRNPVPLGEAFVLTLQYDGGIVNSAPDLSPLDKGFQVISVEKSFQTSNINGQVSQSNQWHVVMAALEKGRAVIPAITVENYSSNPVEIDVVDAGSVPVEQQNTAQVKPNFLVEAVVDNKNPFVQQQINYTLRVYDGGGLQGGEPQIMGDVSDEWIIRVSKQPTIGTEKVNDKDMRVIDFHYALFPQKSGFLRTPEFRFNGYYVTQDNSRRRSFFNSMFAVRNPVVLAAKPIEIDVKPAVKGSSWWIPSSNVEIHAEWDGTGDNFKVDEAFTRTVYLRAEGVLAQQLPNIEFEEIDGIKQYPEKPVEEVVVVNDRIIGIKKVSNVYIPSKAGNFIIPEIKVNWFNIETGNIETAKVEAVEIDVRGALGKAVVHEAKAEIKQALPNVENHIRLSDNDTSAKDLGWMVYLAIFGAFVLGIGFSALFFRSSSNKAARINSAKVIFEALRDNDLNKLRDTLIFWANEKFDGARAHNLNQVSQLVKNKAFSEGIEQLNATLYGKKDALFDRIKFAETFKLVDKKTVKKAKTVKQPLPGLYE